MHSGFEIKANVNVRFFMTLVNDSDLLKYNLEGIIPGPNENEEDFSVRADYCLNLQRQCVNGEGGLPPCVNSDLSTKLLEGRLFRNKTSIRY